jgi:hypothetical protein
MKNVTGLSAVMLAATLMGPGAIESVNASEKMVDTGHCYGKNACKGHNDCKTAKNECGAKGSCRGTGFVTMSTKACGDIGGKIKDKFRGEIADSKLIKCHSVNICGGHNDCKTATNACNGKASCKGEGFVKTTKKACADVGGKVKA